MTNAKPNVVIPNSEVVIPNSEVVIPDSEVVIQDSEVVIPDSEVVIHDSEVVIPDLIRDPVPHGTWIADQVRNDKAESRNDKTTLSCRT